VQAALATLKQLAAADVGRELPSLQESLTTLRNFKIAREGAGWRCRPFRVPGSG
jgi:hypothetical protein